MYGFYYYDGIIYDYFNGQDKGKKCDKVNGYVCKVDKEEGFNEGDWYSKNRNEGGVLVVQESKYYKCY